MRNGPWWRRVARTSAADVESEAQEEVDFHLEMQVRDLEAEGWEPEAARAEARRRFGDVVGVQRRVSRIDRRVARGARWARVWADLRLDVGFALRQFRRGPGFVLVTVLILALGIGSNAAVFGVVDGALLRPLPFPHPEQLLYLFDRQGEQGGLPASVPEYEDWQARADFLQATAALYNSSVTYLGGDTPERIPGAVVAGDYPAVLGMGPLLGRYFDEQEQRTAAPVVLVGERFWRSRLGGRRGVIGQELQLADGPHTIIGVMPDAARILLQRSEVAVWLPLQKQPWMTRGMHFLRVVARRADGVTRATAVSRLAAIAHALQDEGVTRHGIEAGDVRARLVGDRRVTLLLLWGAVGFVLVIVCANLANLFFSRSLGRLREFAVRSAIGAGRFRLVRQLLTESVLLGLLGGLLGLGLARLFIRVVAASAGSAAYLAPASPFDLRVALFTLLLSLLAAVSFGLWPAFRAGHTDVAAVLKETGARAGGARGAWRRRRSLVLVEIAISVVLLAGAGLLVRSLSALLREAPGFDPSGVLTFDIALPSSRYDDAGQSRFFTRLLESIRALPGVTAAGAISELPLDGSDTNGEFVIPGRSFPEGEGPHSEKRIISPGYLRAMHIRLLSGRDFQETDRATAPGVVLISKTLADRYWPGQDPVGQRVEFSWGPAGEQEIAGVVADVRSNALDRQTNLGTMYRPLAQFTFAAMTLTVRTSGDPLALVGSVRRAVHALDPLQPVANIATMEHVVRSSVADRRRLMLLLSGFAALGLLLAALGVYAVSAQAVAQRRGEIGVRMALGASGPAVLWLVLREELLVVLAGLGLGLIGARLAMRLLSASLYGVAPGDPLTFAGVALLLIATATLATILPARRAARLDPVAALRTQ